LLLLSGCEKFAGESKFEIVRCSKKRAFIS
jgi:hypothetical protein